MNNQKLAKEPMHCYTCQNETEERCSYCLLPICAGHGRQVQPWFISRLVMVCLPCQMRLEEIAREELELSWMARAEQQTAGLHVLPNRRL